MYKSTKDGVVVSEPIELTEEDLITILEMFHDHSQANFVVKERGVWRAAEERERGS